MNAHLAPIGHMWQDDDNPVLAIDIRMPQLLPGVDPDLLHCDVCGTTPIQRRDTLGRLQYLLVVHPRTCTALADLYADPRTFLHDVERAAQIQEHT